MSTAFKSRVYTDRPAYADYDAPLKFQAIEGIIARRLRGYSFPLGNRTEYRCIKMNKVYTLDTIKLRLCSNWKEPRKAGEKDAALH